MRIDLHMSSSSLDRGETRRDRIMGEERGRQGKGGGGKRKGVERKGKGQKEHTRKGEGKGEKKREGEWEGGRGNGEDKESVM